MEERGVDGGDLGKSDRYFIVLNCDSENGLSFGMCGREWLLVTPGSPAHSGRASSP